METKHPIEQFANCDDIVLDCSKKLDAVLEVSKSIMGVMDPNDVLNAVVYRLGQELGYTFPAIFLYNENRTKLVIKKIGVGPESSKSFEKFIEHDFESLAFDIGEKKNLVVRAAEDKSIVLSRDLSTFTQPFLTESQTKLLAKYTDVHTIIAVPLFLREEVIGVLVSFSKRDSLDRTEQALLQTFANQISIAIHNAQLFGRVQQQLDSLEVRRRDLEALLDLSDVARSSLNKQEVLQEFLNITPEKLGHRNVLGAAILLEDKTKSELSLFAITEDEKSKKLFKDFKFDWKSASQPIETSEVFRSVVVERHLRLFHDLHLAFPDTIKKSVAKKLKKVSGAETFVAIPIIHGKVVEGVVLLALSEDIENLDERQHEIFQVFTNHIIVTIENVELYEQLQTQYLKVQRQREALAAANDRLKALDQAKSEFISIASHQLRTPLTVIKGYLSLILEGSAGRCDSTAIESVKKVSASTDRLVNLVNDLLDISRIERGILMLDQREARLELLAESVVDELFSVAEKNRVSLTYHRSRRATPHVMIDKKKIREVMMNMVDNAIKYSPDGKIDVYVKKEKNEVLFIVKDTGVGLSPDTIPKLFEKFSRGEGVSVIDTEGVGLGLFVAKRIIDAHEGRIWADSRGKNKGSTFAFSIPISKKRKK